MELRAGARVLAFGEILWDVFESDKSLGGAPLNFALHVSRMGHDAVLVSAVGDDELGHSARSVIRDLGLDSTYIQTTPRRTGTASVRPEGNGQVRFRINRPAAYDYVQMTPEDVERLVTWNPDWLYYGTLSSMAEQPRRLLARLVEVLPRARRFYDVNLRRDSYTPELVADLIACATVVKLNEHEMSALSGMFDLPAADIEEFCRAGAARFGWQAVAVTLGERGCGLWVGGAYAQTEGIHVTVADAVGAGDAFAAAFLHGLSLRWSPSKIGEFANRVGALVASRPGGTPEWSMEEVPPLDVE